MRTLSRLSPIELSSDLEQRTRLGDLWRDQPVVLVFIRHFG